MFVLLYADWPLAWDYLDPIADAIAERHPDWLIDRAGYAQAPSNILYDWVVSCDELSAAPRGRHNLCVFHGLASKGQAFSTARRAAFVDSDTLFAVPGPRYANLLHDMGVPEARITVTGLTKLDGLTRNILYAPTHNPELSAIPVVGERIYELPGVRVRLHMWTGSRNDSHDQAYRSLYPQRSTGSAVADLEWADTVIGDFGSIIVEAIALGKQAVQVVNPRYRDWYYRQGLDDAEIDRLPEVWFPRRYAIQAYTFTDLTDLFGILPTGSPADRVVDVMERSRAPLSASQH